MSVAYQGGIVNSGKYFLLLSMSNVAPVICTYKIFGDVVKVFTIFSISTRKTYSKDLVGMLSGALEKSVAEHRFR